MVWTKSIFILSMHAEKTSSNKPQTRLKFKNEWVLYFMRLLSTDK